jgi:hypothetical protein
MIDPKPIAFASLLLLMLLPAPETFAEKTAPIPGINLSIEVSMGGVSLGAYQGGYLYGQALAHEREEEKEEEKGQSARVGGEYHILTGASAGAINTMGGLFYAFHKQPEDGSSPYKQWLGIGWGNLLQKPANGNNLLSTEAIKAALDSVLDFALAKPDKELDVRKTVWLGFASTRFFPRELRLGKIKSRKLDEKFVIGMQWISGNLARKCGCDTSGCWRAWTEIDQSANLPAKLFLYFGRFGTDKALIRGNLRNLVLASSAFPVAFPRHKLDLRLIDNLDIPWYGRMHGKAMGAADSPAELQIHTGTTDTSKNLLRYRFANRLAHGKTYVDSVPEFSDGGLFENEPLNLARKIHEDLIRKGYRDGEPANALRFLRPMHYNPLFAEGNEESLNRSRISDWIDFLGERRSDGAAAREVNEFIEKVVIRPESIHMSTTNLPLAGEHITHFSAFMRQEFRDFDFAVGLHDALCGEAGTAPKCDMDSITLLLSAKADSTWLARVRILTTVIGKIYASRTDSNGPDSPKPAGFTQSAELSRRASRTIDTIQKELIRDTSSPDAPFRSVLEGSLNRLRHSLNAHADLDDESSAELFEHFAEGYGRAADEAANRLWGPRDPPLGRTFPTYRAGTLGGGALQRNVADSIYAAAGALVGADDLGFKQALLYPLAVYHARVAMGIGWGATPTFHTRFFQIEGATGGFRAHLGIPILPSIAPFVVELGGHFADQDVGRCSARLYLENNWSWWGQIATGVALESKVDASIWNFWPRAELLIADVLVLGMDFNDPLSQASEDFIGKWRRPALSAGLRVGFDPVAVVKAWF